MLLVLLIASAAALPVGNQTWTEEPWTDKPQVSSERLETKLSDPVTFNLSGNEPLFVLLGEEQHNFSDCQSLQSLQCCKDFCSGSSQLWIQKNGTWRLNDQIAAGDSVELIVHTPQDGNADLYLISYSNSSIIHWSFKTLSAFYHRLRLVPQETGRLFLLLSQGSNPSNALILDVLPRQTSPSDSAFVLDVENVNIGEALITVKSERISGFDVYVNGVFFSSDLSDGSLDGTASFIVGSGKTQTITVSQGDGRGNIINRSEHTRSFKRDRSYTLWIG